MALEIRPTNALSMPSFATRGGSASQEDLDAVTAAIAAETAARIAADLLKAPLDSPIFINNPRAPTAPPGTNTTQLANTAFVNAGLTVEANDRIQDVNDEQNRATAAEVALDTAKANKSLALTVSGLVTGGGDLSTTRNFNVSIAAPGHLVDDEDDTRAVTPETLQGIVRPDLTLNYKWLGWSENGIPFVGLDAENKFVYENRDLKAKHARNLTIASTRRRKALTAIASFTADRCAIIGYGQSNMTGVEAWPRRWSSSGSPTVGETIPVSNVLMIGDDTRPNVFDDAHYASFGTAAFNPLVNAMRHPSTGVAQSDATVAAFSAGNLTFGETPTTTASYMLKILMDQYRGRAEGSTSNKIVAMDCAVGGRSLDELRETHTAGSVEYFSRIKEAVALLKTTAAADGGASCEVGAVIFCSGESEYLSASAPIAEVLSETRADIKAKLLAIRNSINAYVMDGTTGTGQKRPPGFYMVIPGGPYTRNLDPAGNRDLYVAMAMMELAAETDGIFVVGPYYHVSDKQNHLDTNGVAWLGSKIGQVIFRTAVQRQGWWPCWPIATETVGAVCDIHFNLPQGQTLANFFPIYNGAAQSPSVFTGWGLRVEDDQSALAFTPKIMSTEGSGSVLRLTLNREPISPAGIYFAEENHNGSGFLSDLEQTDSLWNYLYDAADGYYATVNIAGYVNLRYFMFNPVCPFYIPFNWSIAI